MWHSIDFLYIQEYNLANLNTYSMNKNHDQTAGLSQLCVAVFKQAEENFLSGQSPYSNVQKKIEEFVPILSKGRIPDPHSISAKSIYLVPGILNQPNAEEVFPDPIIKRVPSSVYWVIPMMQVKKISENMDMGFYHQD